MPSCNVMCSNKIKINDNVESLNLIDTSVSVKLIPRNLSGVRFAKKEYIVLVGQDTSSLSCILSVKNEDSTLIVELVSDLYNKKFQISEDTSSVVKKDLCKQVRYHKSSNDILINELKYIFKKVSDDYDVSKLKFISFSILLSGNLAIDISNHYFKKLDARKDFDYEYFENYLFKSHLINELNQIVGVYSICIDEVHIEKPYLISKNSLYVLNFFGCMPENSPKKILDFTVLLELNRI